jgi:asparagine synthase (glutamine-hydrolysing)
VGKHVLKAAVTDLLPADLVWQPKRGFMTPVAEWFRGPLGERFEEQIDRSALNELGIIDRGAVRELLALHRSRRAERSFQLWTILNLSVWFDHWIARRDPITV